MAVATSNADSALSQQSLFPKQEEKPFAGTFETYHLAWLTAHPERTKVWLKARLREGFHVHHIDGDHANNAPANLVLIDGTDHMRLHGMELANGIARWRRRRSNAAETKREQRTTAADSEIGEALLYLERAERERLRQIDRVRMSLGDDLLLIAQKCVGAGIGRHDAAHEICERVPGTSWREAAKAWSVAKKAAA